MAAGFQGFGGDAGPVNTPGITQIFREVAAVMGWRFKLLFKGGGIQATGTRLLVPRRRIPSV